MNDLVCEKAFDHWEELITEITLNKSDDLIYRGHSNLFNNDSNNTKDWALISSFNRNYPPNKYPFRTYLRQQFDDQLFKSAYHDYKYENIKALISCEYIERLYFLQHYGVPTCLIDFSKDPLVAAYFAISNIKADSGGSYDEENNPVFYSDDCYLSIVSINYKILKEKFGIQSIDNKNFNRNNYENYFLCDGYIGLDINPLSNCLNIENYNLKNQHSSFILYDNEGSGLDLFQFLLYIKLTNSIKIEKPFINIYKLKYNGVFKKGKLKGNLNQRFYGFLNEKEKTGRYLFNDLQGLKYDFNFFHYQ